MGGRWRSETHKLSSWCNQLTQKRAARLFLLSSPETRAGSFFILLSLPGPGLRLEHFPSGTQLNRFSIFAHLLFASAAAWLFFFFWLVKNVLCCLLLLLTFRSTFSIFKNKTFVRWGRSSKRTSPWCSAVFIAISPRFEVKLHISCPKKASQGSLVLHNPSLAIIIMRWLLESRSICSIKHFFCLVRLLTEKKFYVVVSWSDDWLFLLSFSGSFFPLLSGFQCHGEEIYSEKEFYREIWGSRENEEEERSHLLDINFGENIRVGVDLVRAAPMAISSSAIRPFQWWLWQIHARNFSPATFSPSFFVITLNSSASFAKKKNFSFAEKHSKIPSFAIIDAEQAHQEFMLDAPKLQRETCTHEPRLDSEVLEDFFFVSGLPEKGEKKK